MLTLRMLGALVAGMGTALYGFGVSQGIIKKCRVRSILIKVLHELERGISAGRAICDIFAVYMADGCDTDIPQRLSQALCEKSDKPLYNALKCYDGVKLLDMSERNELFDFALHLGTYGSIDEEIMRCRKVISLLEQRKAECEKPDRQKAELAAKLGLLAAGAVVVIGGF